MKDARNAYLGLIRIISYLKGKCKLTYEDYLEITQLPCYFCEKDPTEQFFDETTGSIKKLHRITRLDETGIVEYINAIPICIRCRNKRRTEKRKNG
jgi:hypothetical protein